MTLVATPQQTSGPLFGFALLFDGSENAVAPTAPDALTIEGRVVDETGLPLVWEAMLEFWTGEQFARTRTMDDGAYAVVIRKPGAGTAPDGSGLAPFLNVALFGRGLNRRLDTRVYFPDEAAANAADPVLNLVPPARVDTLIARPTNQAGKLRLDIVLRGANETVFFAY